MKTKSKASIALILALTITATLIITMLPATAQTPIEINTFAFILPTPNPVGVDQQMIVTFRIDKVAVSAGATGGNFEGFMVYITTPSFFSLSNVSTSTKVYSYESC